MATFQLSIAQRTRHGFIQSPVTVLGGFRQMSNDETVWDYNANIGTESAYNSTAAA